jgi:diadenosine tetraphosphate (Ap4A) HIT family hydrolase
MRTAKCPFCNISDDRIIASDSNVIAVTDRFPVAKGHSLVIPKKHIRSIFQLEMNEQAKLWEFAVKLRRLLAEKFKPNGLNIGVNDGKSAGQTVEHAHMHIIPRYERDVEDPRGGIRWIIPSKAKYWE